MYSIVPLICLMAPDVMKIDADTKNKQQMMMILWGFTVSLHTFT
jgi:hypothetical protein